MMMYVPWGCASKYKEDWYWKQFKHIVEYATPDDDVKPDTLLWFDENYEILGDTNLSGDIEVGDVTQLINCIIGTAQEHSGFADVNDDGDIDVKDVTSLINLILN